MANKLVPFEKLCWSGKEEARTGGSTVDTVWQRASMGITEMMDWINFLIQPNVLRRILGQIESCSGTPFTQVNAPGLSTRVLMADPIVVQTV